jgi:hypothetical protein
MLYPAPAGLGVDSIAHLVPFHRSANVASPTVSLDPPTAVHAVAEVHDTALKKLCVAPAGVGTDWIDQLVPFHSSEKVPCGLLPTAVQAVADVHDTPLRTPNVVPVGVGTGWRLHLVPSQRSAKMILGLYLPRENSPTSVHAVADVHDTPLRTLNAVPVGWGVSWRDQLVPFQRSVDAIPKGLFAFAVPTAVQAVDEVHDTPLSPNPGAVCSVQLVPSHRSVKV